MIRCLEGARAERGNGVATNYEIFRRKADRRVRVAAAVYSAEHAFVDLWHRNADAYRPIVAEVMNRTGAVAVVGAQPRTRVVKTPVLIFRRANPFDRVRISIRCDFEGQAALFGFL